MPNKANLHEREPNRMVFKKGFRGVICQTMVESSQKEMFFYMYNYNFFTMLKKSIIKHITQGALTKNNMGFYILLDSRYT